MSKLPLVALLCLSLLTPTARAQEADAVPAADVAAPSAPDASAYPLWSGLVVAVGAQGLLTPSGPGGNPRPLSLGVGYSRWSERGAVLVQAQVGPAVTSDGPGAAGGLLLRPSGRLGLSASGRLHRLGERSPLPLTVGAYLTAGASLDSAAGASWTSLRADGGLALHWWQVATPTRLVLGTVEGGLVVRRRAGEASGTWFGASVGANVTVQRVTAGVTLVHVPANGAAPVVGLTGTTVTAGLSLLADVLPL